MAIKFVVLAALVAMAHCSVVPVVQVDDEKTSFSYDVADPITGDFKSQTESRSGGNVVGQYSLLEADGTKRTVDYTADDVNGFNAVVRNDPAVIPAPEVAATPVVVSAPVVTAPAVPAAPVVDTAAEVIAARSFAAPTIYRAAVLPSVYRAPVVPSFYGAPVVPSVYSSFAAPSVYRTVAVPPVYRSPLTLRPVYRSLAAPSTYTSVVSPSVAYTAQW